MTELDTRDQAASGPGRRVLAPLSMPSALRVNTPSVTLHWMETACSRLGAGICQLLRCDLAVRSWTDVALGGVARFLPVLDRKWRVLRPEWGDVEYLRHLVPEVGALRSSLLLGQALLVACPAMATRLTGRHTLCQVSCICSVSACSCGLDHVLCLPSDLNIGAERERRAPDLRPGIAHDVRSQLQLTHTHGI
jgi:hypothetical protein